MRLAEFYYRVKDGIWHSRDLPKDVFVFLLLCLVGVGAFLLGRISTMEVSRKAELKIVQADTLRIGEGTVLSVGNSTSSTGVPTTGSVDGMYVGSRNGTTYYLPWCGGVKLIHEENKIWFVSKEDAAAKGYKPAGNCRGI